MKWLPFLRRRRGNKADRTPEVAAPFGAGPLGRAGPVDRAGPLDLATPAIGLPVPAGAAGPGVERGPAPPEPAAAVGAQHAPDAGQADISAPHSAMQGLMPLPLASPWTGPEPPPPPRILPAPAFEEGPYPGSARPASGGTAPSDEFTVKGSEISKLYHTKDSPFYAITMAEVWFRNEADARRAGFSAWRTVRQL